MNVSLFVTCLVDQIYPQVGVSTVRLLRKFGCTVDFPLNQTCCGQPAFNSGFTDDARKAAVVHLNAFKDSDYIVSPSGSCTSMVHHYYEELFQDDPHLLEQARRIASISYEFSQFMVNVLGISDVGATFPHTVAYHPACHGSRLLGIKDEPITLLNHVKNLTLVDLPRAQDCCGFGGAFAVKLADISGAMLQEKVDHVRESSAEYLVSTDMGCLMNIGGMLRRNPASAKPIHLIQLLDQGSK